MPTPVSPAPASVPVSRWTPQPLPAQPTAEHVGKLFADRYLLNRKIGGGGMSTIYEASDSNLGVRCVVKIMRGDLPSDPVDRFRREAHVLASLSHEHIARIIDRHDPEQGPRFLVTEYIDGLDLSLLRRRGAIPAAAVVVIGLQVSAALAHAHAAGVTHRDINPSNVMLVRHPSGDIFVKVIDFGIAKLGPGSDLASPDNAPPGARRATRGDIVLGTVPYYRGHEGPQRDVYALALTLAELLTGEAPDPTADLSRTAIPPELTRVLTAALSDELTTMDAFHASLLRVSDTLDPGDAQAERRRYIARAFPSDPLDRKPPASDPERFAGRYIVCGELGQGGMGRVQVAFDVVARRKVALKTIHPRCAGNKNLEFRFRREARALAAIEHTGAPELYEIGDTPQHYFTMKIVEGVTLAATLKRGKIDPYRALSLAIDLGDILRAAHEVGVIHRDVKPDNIIIGHGDRVRLIDFGACLLMPRFHQRHLLFPTTPPDERFSTGELETVGTPGYTAPEILGMESSGGPRSDIYSVCAVLYEMLTGRPLIDRATGRMQPIDRGELPFGLAPMADLLRRGTEHEPNDRVWTMAELVRALEIFRANLLHTRQRRKLVLVALAAVASTATALQLFPARTAASQATTLPAPAPVHRPITHPPPAQLAEATPAPPTPREISAAPRMDTLPPHPAPASPPAPRSSRAAATPGPLTEPTVAARVASRKSRLKTCGLPLLVLKLTIHRTRATISAVNGMPFTSSDPHHACIRRQLQGLAFPFADKPATFRLPLDLSRPGAHENP